MNIVFVLASVASTFLVLAFIAGLASVQFTENHPLEKKMLRCSFWLGTIGICFLIVMVYVLYKLVHP